MIKAITPNYDVEHTGKRLRVRLHGDIGDGVVICPTVATDKHTVLNIRSELRREAARVGAH